MLDEKPLIPNPEEEEDVILPIQYPPKQAINQDISWYKGKYVVINNIDKLNIRDKSTNRDEIIKTQKDMIQQWYNKNPNQQYAIFDIDKPSCCLKFVPTDDDHRQQLVSTGKSYITVCIREGENEISKYFTVQETQIKRRNYSDGGKKTRRKRVKNKQTRRKKCQKRRNISRRRRRHTKKY